jgi:hypothetical protein
MNSKIIKEGDIELELLFDTYEEQEGDHVTPYIPAHNKLVQINHKGEDITDLVSFNMFVELQSRTYEN